MVERCLLPILNPDGPPCDGPSMVLIKGCGLCGQWYHCFDVVVTSYLHTYHPTCLGEHLKIHNKCKVCNQRFHLDWWSSWGFRNMDDDLIFVAQEMGVEEEHARLLNVLK
jgi:hypothetical protein